MRDYVRLQEASPSDGKLILRGTSKDDPFEETCDRLILASSMEPVLDGFGLENSPVKTAKGTIAVDSSQRTSVEGLRRRRLHRRRHARHLAEYHALAAVSSMTGGNYTVDYDAVPACVFMNPEVGTVGLTEEEALARGERPFP